MLEAGRVSCLRDKVHLSCWLFLLKVTKWAVTDAGTLVGKALTSRLH